jgi:anaerobic dimethyl sulfoxide reductase subunit C
MNVRELSLVAFTLLIQTSVGIVVVFAALPLSPASQAKAGGDWPLIGHLPTPLVVAAAAAGLGLLASLLHLGQPLLAWLALANVRGSWLSREIVLVLLFVVGLAGFVLTYGDSRLAPVVRATATALAVVAGLALVFAMARLYMVAGQPAWDRLITPVNFFASTVLLGLVVLVVASDPPLGPGADRVVASAAIALLACQVLLVPALLSGVPAEPAAAISAASVGHAATWLAAARIVAALAAAALLVLWLRGGPAVHVPMFARWAALALVVVSEIFGRALFYAAAVRLGPA